MYTEKEISIAKELNRPETLAFLRKVLNEKDASELEAEKNVIALSNERYGEMMKVFHVARVRTENRLAHISRLAKTSGVKNKVAIAPK